MTHPFTENQRQQLLANGSPGQRGQDHVPVVKLSLPGSSAVWLLTELDQGDPDIVFGLCDPGLGFPELGYVSLGEMQDAAASFGSELHNHVLFSPHHPISIYARAARLAGEITFDERLLENAVSQPVASSRRPEPPMP